MTVTENITESTVAAEPGGVRVYAAPNRRHCPQQGLATEALPELRATSRAGRHFFRRHTAFPQVPYIFTFRGRRSKVRTANGSIWPSPYYPETHRDTQWGDPAEDVRAKPHFGMRNLYTCRSTCNTLEHANIRNVVENSVDIMIRKQ